MGGPLKLYFMGQAQSISGSNCAVNHAQCIEYIITIKMVIFLAEVI